MDIQWDDMRIFLAVARAESLSGAGRLLKLDPATVGRRIARLEEGLATPLFVKSPQGYALSEAGRRLMAYGEDAEQALILGAEDLRGQAGTLSGQVRIGAPDGCANYLLPQVVTRIAARNPGLEIQIIALPRVFNLSKREADMAVAVSQPTHGRLSVQKIIDYHLHLAANRRYLRRHADIRSLADLARHRIVGYIPDLIFDKELDYLSEIGVQNANLASNSVSVQFQMLRAGGGIGFVHDFAMPFGPDLRPVLPAEVALRRSFYLIRHADDRKVERLNRVAEMVVAGIRQEVERIEAGLTEGADRTDARSSRKTSGGKTNAGPPDSEGEVE